MATITIKTTDKKINDTFPLINQVGNAYYFSMNGKPHVAWWDGKKGSVSRTMKNPMSVPKSKDLKMLIHNP